ncbi:hypothetical protein G7Y89_g12572 [Cudoniella acicularis]|uniref:AAA+ ATPase domain-containing protein n=1 Tax=Cudoniella acicularis TaxID=354080 RepID=A0A8H4RBK5_9HELO|nr:hypothetical protein G7Y89_g12572 [Cudoniella acicularis]
MSSSINIANSGQAAELRAMTTSISRLEGTEAPPETIATNDVDSPLEISRESKETVETSISAEKDAITITTESAISSETVIALGGKEAATQFVEKFAASFAQKYSEEFKKQLTEAARTVNPGSEGTGISPVTSNVSTESRTLPKEDSPAEKVITPDSNPIVSPDDVDWGGKPPSGEGYGDFGSESEDSSTSGPLPRPPRKPRRGSVYSEDSLSGSEELEVDYLTKEATVDEMKVQVWKVDDIFDSTIHERTFVAFDPIRRPTGDDEELSSERYGKWAMVLRRVFDHDNTTLMKTKLDIQSPLILEVLQERVEEEKAALVSKASVKWPNDNVFRYRKQIKETAIEKGELAIKHVDLLLELIQEEYASKIRDIENMFPKGTSSFEILREAFWPGDIAVEGTASDAKSYRIVSAKYRTLPSYGSGPPRRELAINVEYIDFDGREFGTVDAQFSLPEFEGMKYLNELDIFPLQYHPDHEAMRERLLERGRKFVSLKGRQHKMYSGPVSPPETPRRRGDMYSMAGDSGGSREITSQIIIDTTIFNRLTRIRPIVVAGIEGELVDDELTEHHLKFCTDKIPFFSLEDKNFHQGKIANVSDKIFDKHIFSQLVLPNATKKLVQVLVKNHTNGKGQGIVLLLHGPPGVGKTMTAEAVAEYTHRPLYVVTCGELGTTAPALEESLERVLDIASSFGAVLLLDEADVFLEQRTPHDVQRNALVSIFLRLLEYYKGILFLTTNRVRTFDEAFHSRIHITLAYSNHGTAARERIWRNFGMHLAAELNIRDVDYKELAESELNGRQIKNVLGSCKALAADRGEKITMDDLRSVLEISVAAGSKWLDN